jgi:hypothetical protein
MVTQDGGWAGRAAPTSVGEEAETAWMQALTAAWDGLRGPICAGSSAEGVGVRSMPPG